MYPITRRFAAALTQNHRVVSRVDVLNNGKVERTLDVTEGSVTVDGEADIRRRMSCTLVDPDGDLTPGEAEHLLAPYGNEVRIYRGIAFTGELAGDRDDSQGQWADGVHMGTEAAPDGTLRLNLGG